ncbi:hypothetical protein LINGRAPRIM_LOCUS65 [Linum grandiflorum]
MCGDFNAILLHYEKLSPHNSHSNSIATFQPFVSQLGLHDIHPLGPFFTWTNKQTPDTLVRLDRFLASSDWLRLFPKGTITNLSDVGSDHRAILYLHHRLSAPPCYFSFENRWTTNQEAKEIIQTAWASSKPTGSCLFRLHKKLAATRYALVNWQKLGTSNSHRMIKTLKNRVQDLHLSYPRQWEEIRQTELSLKSALRLENEFWSTKARINWDIKGDRNTSYFQRIANHRARRNFIFTLSDPSGATFSSETDK